MARRISILRVEKRGKVKMTWLKTGYSKLVITSVGLAFPIAFVLSIPWLKQQSDLVVYICTGIAAAGTILASMLLAIRKDQNMDEWHRSAARFSSQWGWLAGAGVVPMLLVFPPLQNLIISISGMLGDVSAPDKQLVLMAFLLGFMCLVLAQMLCTVLLSAGWRFWMSRSD